MSEKMTSNVATKHMLECDYLVVGAGAASLAFVDTMLTELPNIGKIILIDKKEHPGGHWVDAYGFVRLHQPSRFYGIASSCLEDSWIRTKQFDKQQDHRANKHEILAYFRRFVDAQVASGRLEFYPKCVYKFETNDQKISDQKKNDSDLHIFRSVDGSELYQVKVNCKLIDGTKGECIIPHGAC